MEWVTGEPTQGARMQAVAWPTLLSGAALALMQSNPPPSLPRCEKGDTFKKGPHPAAALMGFYNK